MKSLTLHANDCVRVRDSVRVRMCVRVHVCAYVCLHVCLCACVGGCACACVCVCVSVYEAMTVMLQFRRHTRPLSPDQTIMVLIRPLSSCSLNHLPTSHPP